MPPATEWSLVVLQSMRGRLSSLTRRVARLEACSSPVLDQPRRSHEGDVPLGPLLDAVLDALNAFNDTLESITGELTGFDARLARLEDAQVRFPTRPPRLVSSGPAAATVRAARGRLMRKAVSRA